MSTTFNCLGCGREKASSPRSAGRQSYCGDKSCQQIRKTSWQRQKMAVDPDYRDNQNRSYQVWKQNNCDYWSKYRAHHPDQAQRNREAQQHRNQSRRQKSQVGVRLEIAKMDALKVKLSIITDDCI